MTKIYINEEGQPMHNPKGWPEVPPVKASIYAETFAMQAYDKAIEKAKAEAIPFDLDNDQASFHAINNVAHFKTWKPGSFIEIDAEVEVVEQYYDGSVWCDVAGQCVLAYQKRKIARIKKQESGPYLESREPFKLEDFIKKLVRGFYGIGAVGWAPNPDTDFEHAWKRYINDGIIPEWRTHCSDWKERMPLSILSENIEPLTLGEEMEQIRRYGQDMQRENAELKAKIEKAEARVKEIENIFEAEWTKASEVKPRMNTAVEVFIPEEDNHITVGMWDVSEKWVLLDEYRVPQSEVTYWRWLREEPEDKSYTPTPDFDGRPIGQRITEAFDKAWKIRQVIRMNATEVLSQVLDELNIK
jgi:hypothetical protein